MDLFLRLYFRLNFNRINTMKLRNLNLNKIKQVWCRLLLKKRNVVIELHFALKKIISGKKRAIG